MTDVFPFLSIMRTLSRRIPIRNRGYTVAYQACGPLSCNMFALVCNSTKEAVVIDPSCGNSFEFHSFHRFVTEQHGARLTHVLLTHAHPDHIVGVPEIVRWLPQVSLHLHPLEEENYRTAHDFGLKLGLPISIDNLPTPTHELSDGQVIRVGDSIELTVVHTPGHSPGHVAFVDRRTVFAANKPIQEMSLTIVDTGDRTGIATTTGDDHGSVLFSGDLLFRGSVGRTDLHNASMEDLFASLRRMYESFDDASIVLSGHTTPTFLKRERQKNPFVDLALKRPQEWYEECKERNEWVDFEPMNPMMLQT
jgi:hydroxyacylglutathione hydrolase